MKVEILLTKDSLGLMSHAIPIQILNVFSVDLEQSSFYDSEFSQELKGLHMNWISLGDRCWSRINGRETTKQSFPLQ